MKLKQLCHVAVICMAILFGIMIDRAVAGQPHMQAARDHLQAARADLQAAEHDKAGHRERALQLVGDALGQVNAGIQAGR